MEQAAAGFRSRSYRNLAVYWKQRRPGPGQCLHAQALALDPKVPYNLVFAAVFMAASGNGDEALKMREQTRPPACVVQPRRDLRQTGDRKRHSLCCGGISFQYERYQAVRAKEMMEARVDAVFDSIRYDSSFLALTSGADGKTPDADERHAQYARSLDRIREETACLKLRSR